MFFFLAFGMAGFKLFNLNMNMFNNDYSHSFRILPDYLTGTTFVSYRKERKQALYQ